MNALMAPKTVPDLLLLLLLISLVLTRDLKDPVRIGSAIWYQMGPLTKVIQYGTISFQFRTGLV